MRDFAKQSDVTVGTHLVVGDGFTCMEKGTVVVVTEKPDGELVVPCAHGDHSLLGQLTDDDTYIGLRLTQI